MTLLDTWGPGNSRASSGGESRVIRGGYGSDKLYVEMVARSLELWKDNQKRWNRPLYRQQGAIWLVSGNDEYEKASLPPLREVGLEFEELSTSEAAKRFPQVNFEGIPWVIYEKDAGYLLARRACASVVEGFQAEGGEYRQSSVKLGGDDDGKLRSIELSDGSILSAERYVFACGPWLGNLFPDTVGDLIRISRQEVFFFGTPDGDGRFSVGALPVWLDYATMYYGIVGGEWRGFKIAKGGPGPGGFDPTAGDRSTTPEALAAARSYMDFRFPALKGAPLLEGRVCQYSNTPDGNFILDRHPNLENVWLAGGGSGHGFKHGPAVGERVAELVAGERRADPFFSLSRFSGKT